MDFALPLVCAVAKVQAATRVLGGQQEPNYDDLETQVILKIDAVVMERFNMIRREVERLTKEITAVVEKAQAREREILVRRSLTSIDCT